jgi:hypothetical protein
MMIDGLSKRIRKDAYRAHFKQKRRERRRQRRPEGRGVYDPELVAKWKEVSRLAVINRRRDVDKRKTQIATYSRGERYDRSHFLAKKHHCKFSEFKVNAHDYAVRLHSAVNQLYMKDTFDPSWGTFWAKRYGELQKMVAQNEHGNGLERAQAEIFNHARTLMHDTALITPAEFDKHRISYEDPYYKKMRSTNPENAYFVTAEVKAQNLAAYEVFKKNNSFAWFKNC